VLVVFVEWAEMDLLQACLGNCLVKKENSSQELMADPQDRIRLEEH
jgi:hypothetical protein